MGTNVAPLMDAAGKGDPSAADALFAALYAELHRIAKRQLAREGNAMTLGATTLLHQAYIEMATMDGTSFPSEGQFMAYAARVMRSLIIDHARNRCALKRGGQFEITAVPADMEASVKDAELLGISDALDRLAKAEPQLAEIVDLRFFCGFTLIEIAAMRSLSERTVQRHWEKARIYLYNEIQANLEA